MSFKTLRFTNDSSISYTLINSRFYIEIKSSLGELPSENLQLGFLGGSDGRESACKVGDPGSIPGSRRSPGKGSGNLLLVFLPGESTWIEEPGGLQSLGSQRGGQD